MARDAIGRAGGEAALKAVVEAAAGGDARAPEVLLSRCWPARKGRPVILRMPDVSTPEGVTAAMASVVQAVADGC